MMRRLIDDLRYARRTLLGHPGFTLAAIVAIGAGIGANATVFSAIRAILLRPLPYTRPEQLMVVWQVRPDGQQNFVSARNFEAWRERSKTFASMAALAVQYFTLTGSGDAEQIIAGQVKPELFPILGAQPLLGRSLRREETGPAAPRVVVLGHSVWLRRFGGRADVVGTSITLNGAPYEIVGVMPPDFYFLSKEIAIWVPLAPNATYRADFHGLEVVGRLVSGTSIEQARAEMTAIAKALELERPERNRGWGARVVSLHDDTVGKVRPSLLALWGAAGLLLMIAVSNVSNLLLARAAARQPEIAVRCALGAGPRRLMHQLLTESVILGIAGGVLGIVVAAAATRLLLASGPDNIPRLDEASVDGWVLAFTAGVTLTAALIFGIVPAWKSSSPDLVALLKEEGRGSSGGRGTRRWQRWLVSWQIAISVLLLSGAALLAGSFRNLQRVDRGFRPEGVLSLRMSMLRQYTADRARAKALFQAIVDRLGSLPGVRYAALSTGIPLDGRQSIGMQYQAEGITTANGADRPVAITHMVTPGYLAAVGLRLREGRWLSDHDREGGAPVIVVSRSLADRNWPQGAVGKRLIVGQPGGGAKTEIPREIIGVVEDIVYPTGRPSDHIEVYFPFAQTGWAHAYAYLRSDTDPAALGQSARRAIAQLDSEVPVDAVRSLEEELSRVNSRRRFDSEIAASLAVLALVLTVIGVYGVISCSAMQQTRDIAVRVAFGAQPSDITRHVLRETLWMSAGGIVIGMAACYPMIRFLADMLYQVDYARFWLPLAAGACLTALALVVSLVPARRTAKLDPAAVLHEPPRW
jgi:putative ABC transport system permease protein